MPYVDIRLVGTALTPAQRNALLGGTTELMVTVMGKRREVTVVSIQQYAGENWSVGGNALRQQEAPGASVEIKVTQGTNTEREKAAMIAETTAMLKNLLGTTQTANYVVIHEIAADAWGYDGLTQAHRKLSGEIRTEAVNPEMDH